MSLGCMLEKRIQVSSLDDHGSREGVTEGRECGAKENGQPKKIGGPLYEDEKRVVWQPLWPMGRLRILALGSMSRMLLRICRCPLYWCSGAQVEVCCVPTSTLSQPLKNIFSSLPQFNQSRS